MTGAGSAEPRFAVPTRLDLSLLEGFDRSARVVDLNGETMGTFWHVRMAVPPGRDIGNIQRAIAARLETIVAEMSHWSATSLLSHYNQAPTGSWTALPPDFATVMVAGLQVAALSDGAFDPTLGRLTDLWGIGPNARAEAPTAEAIAEALGQSGWRRVTFDAGAQRLHQPGDLWLDLSGIAKGHAADAVADLLGDAGLRHVLVEIGGECVGRGIRPDGDPWWVDLETPQGLALPPLRIALHELAVATSGDYVRGAHTLDPRTGNPVRHATMAVSVLHARCMMADAWASALHVLDPDDALAMADREDIAVRILGRDGSERLSSALRDML